MATRNYQSIGEVLVGVKTEFPDITISKIRFLESEGLIQPERTPSGYRKFYEDDVERLRQILRLQRDEYLPLKVIKDRLARLDAGEPPEPSEDGQGVETGSEKSGDEELAEPATGLQMSIEEMASATGMERERITELEGYGLVCGHGPESARYYDGDDYVVLSIVRDFFRFGVEPRHLTMYKHFAEREASFFEAIVMPTLRQRNPDARRAAADSLGELSKVSRKLKQALLRTNLRQYLQAP
jgi:DNA-binding transcriptional MerR regulator